MKKRSPVAVLLLPFVTFGIYSIYWEVKTKIELNASKGTSIPTAWLLIVPIVNIWWLWKYSEGVDKATNGETSTVMAFILLFLLGFIGQAIIQNEFNKLDTAAAPSMPPPAPAASPTPTVPPVPPATPETPAAPQPPVPPVV